MVTLVRIGSALFFAFVAFAMCVETAEAQNPIVIVKTNMGTIEIELYKSKAPISVNNFLSYVNEAFYDSTVFHRVIPGFMIQGGGYTPSMSELAKKEPIKNEATNRLQNSRGTVAMARTSDVNSATCQFFINVADNDFLNHKDNTPEGFGYAVFGRVKSGMDVADAISNVKTRQIGQYANIPVEPVIIESIRVKK